jgi:TIR domain
MRTLIYDTVEISVRKNSETLRPIFKTKDNIKEVLQNVRFLYIDTKYQSKFAEWTGFLSSLSIKNLVIEKYRTELLSELKRLQYTFYEYGVDGTEITKRNLFNMGQDANQPNFDYFAEEYLGYLRNIAGNIARLKGSIDAEISNQSNKAISMPLSVSTLTTQNTIVSADTDNGKNQNPISMKQELEQIKKLFIKTDKNQLFTALSLFIQKYNLTQAEFDLLNLQADYQIFQREERNGVLSNQEAAQKNAQFGVRILKLIEYMGKTASEQTSAAVEDPADSLQENALTGTSSQPIKENKNPTPMPKQVFISYNHGDKDAARHLKNALEKAGIQVTIDSEAMKAGSKISDFIRQSIQNTEVTVSIISEKSLLSAWVAMESILTMHNQKQFIACYITDKFFEMSFVRTSGETIEKRIQEIQTEVQECFKIGMGIEHLSDELSRQQDLKHNLPKIVSELRSRLCIDIAGYNFIDNVPKVIEAILK